MRFKNIVPVVSSVMLFSGIAFAQRNVSLGENAALRYWSAFSQVQDLGITNEQAKELNATLDGTVPYDDSKYKELVEKNALPLEIMVRATSIPNCDWGLDYSLKAYLPVEYARRALVLGRLNVLNSFHLEKTGDVDGAVRSLTAGLRFSRDVGNGGSLFATAVAKDLLARHLRSVADLLHTQQLSRSERSQLQKAVEQLGAHGVEWLYAITKEIDLLSDQPWPPDLSQVRIREAYLAALNDPARLGNLQEYLSRMPEPVRDLIPDPKRVVREKQELDSQISQTRRLLE